MILWRGLADQCSPWGVNDPDVGSRVVLTDPWDPENSEFTWFSDGRTDYTDTRGSKYSSTASVPMPSVKSFRVNMS